MRMDIRKVLCRWSKIVVSVLVVTFQLCYGTERPDIVTVGDVKIRIAVDEYSTGDVGRATNEEVQKELKSFMWEMLNELPKAIRELDDKQSTTVDTRYNKEKVQLVSQKLGGKHDQRVLWRRVGETVSTTGKEILLLVEHHMTNNLDVVEKKAAAIVEAIGNWMNGESEIKVICGKSVMREHDKSVELVQEIDGGVMREGDEVGVAIGLHVTGHKIQIGTVDVESQTILVRKGKRVNSREIGRYEGTIFIEHMEDTPRQSFQFEKVEKEKIPDLPPDLPFKKLWEQVHKAQCISIPSHEAWSFEHHSLKHLTFYEEEYMSFGEPCNPCIAAYLTYEQPSCTLGGREVSSQPAAGRVQSISLMGPLKDLLLDILLTMWSAAIQCAHKDKSTWKDPPIHVKFQMLDLVINFPNWYMRDCHSSCCIIM